jgi:general secretion pathway protein D
LLRSTQRADSLTSDRYDYILGEQFKARLRTDMLPDFGSPILPPRQGAAPAGTDKPATTAPK